ncbi:MAG TPA: HAD hydrolase family protein [Acidimicrobiales bacterium]|nr:HAD hydrolase family protein [Acidimicrobiales bacterium]
MTTVVRDVAPGEQGAPLGTRAAPLDLLGDLEALVSMLGDELTARNWLDAYLLAAGVHQVLADACPPARRLLRRVAAYAREREGRTAAAAARGARLAERAASAVGRRERRVEASALAGLERLLAELAGLVVGGGDGATPMLAARLEEHGSALVEALAPLGARYAGEVLRPPSCFHSFDQRPADLVELATRYAARWPDRSRPITVVGVRTSGSYLAPLLAAGLARLGFREVGVASARPGWPVAPSARATLCRCAARGGSVLVVDDPPQSGRSLAAVVDGLRCEARVQPSQLVLALASFDAEARLPDALGGIPALVLPFDEWACHRQFRPEEVARSLARLLGPAAVVEEIEALGPATRPARGHLRRAFRVRWRDASVVRIEPVVAQGVGLGYFGRRAVALATAAPSLFAPVIGLVDGVLYHRQLPEARRLDGERLTAEVAPLVAAHAAQRERALGVARDRAALLAGRQPVWEVAARLVGRPLGPLELAMRPLVSEPVARRLVEASVPAVTDGPAARGGWFLTDWRRPAVREDFAEGSGGHLDLASYDVAADLAACASASGDPAFPAALRTAFEAASGRRVEPERWLVFQLVHLWNLRRLAELDPDETARRQARAFQRFVHERYLADLDPPPEGPWCALDLDGVLETTVLGFPATTHLGAMALRALRAHGYRVVLATGRSLDEVVDRCVAWGLPGGVGEYGGVVHDGRDASVRELLHPPERAALDALRETCDARPDVVIDASYRRSVRAYRRGPGGRRVGLEPALVAHLVDAAGVRDEVVPVYGEEQTDFVARGCDKAVALRALLGAGGVDAEPRLALAVGDSEADAGMLALASLALAPANAAPALAEAGAQVLRDPYQAGLAEAVRRLLGHRPGGCERCALAPGAPPARALLELLSLREAGLRGVPLRLARLLALRARLRDGS